MRVAIGSSDTCLPKVDIQTAAVHGEKFEVVRSRFDRDNVSLGVPGMEPEDATANICATVYQERLASRGDDLLIDTLDENTVRSYRHIVLLLGKALLDGLAVGIVIPPMLYRELHPAARDLGTNLAEGKIGVRDAAGQMHNRLHNAKCGASYRRRHEIIDSPRLKTHRGCLRDKSLLNCGYRVILPQPESRNAFF
jgi:hypothetical protein